MVALLGPFSIISDCPPLTPISPPAAVSVITGLVMDAVVIDWVMVPLPPAVKATLVDPFSSAPSDMFPLLVLEPPPVVFRLIVAPVMPVLTVIPAVVGEVPGALPLALTSNAFQLPVTDDNVNVLFDTY